MPLFVAFLLISSLPSLLSLKHSSSSSSPPVWSSTYSVQGVLSIPFAEITEPFDAWADMAGKKSRIDYYGGMVKTFQRGDVGQFGTIVKVAPMTNEIVVNQISCFQVNGSDDMTILPQSILPDIFEFELIGNEYKEGQDCEKWRKTEQIGQKVNKYTIWLKLVKTVATPIHYEMRGYNSLLGSHYDHYFITYDKFSPEVPDDAVFADYDASSCHGWPGPGKDHVYTMNPMKEFVDSHTQHVTDTFDQFKQRHGKVYVDGGDEQNRLDVYRQNLRFIHSKNRQGLTYSLAANHMADFTDTEMRTIRGKLFDPELKYNGGQEFRYTEDDLDQAPDTLDWRLYGAVTPVKDQSVCGSCWSFGTVGTLEGTLYLHTGSLVRLSQQALVDCSWGFGNNGCDGGEDFRAYEWMMKHGGIPTEDSYGPYLGQDSYCRLNQSTMGLKISGFVNVTSGDLGALKVAIAARGPVSVAIDASHKSLSFYSNGVYYEPKCSSDLDGLDYAVLAVGYGSIAGQNYWLVKNSWSTYWGNDGYVLMSQMDNNCGVATSATYVIPNTGNNP